MTPSIVLQVLNAELAMLSLCTFCIFVHYLFKNIDLGYDFLRAAIAFMFLFLADMILRFPMWYSRSLVNMGFPIPPPDAWLIVGGSLNVAALLCIIRVFSPAEWAHKSWAAALFVSTVATVLSVAFTLWR